MKAGLQCDYILYCDGNELKWGKVSFDDSKMLPTDFIIWEFNFEPK